MRDYYARYFREVGRDLSWFTKGQIIVSLIAGTGAAFVGNALGTITDALVWKSACVGVICYVGILAVRAAWSAVNAPVTLDRLRQTELNAAKDQNSKALLELTNGIANERGHWAKGATDMNNALAACREQLARKHPSDTVKEQHVRDSLKKFEPEQIDAVKWLLHNGETHELDFPSSIPHFQIAMNKAAIQTSPKLVVYCQAVGANNKRPGRPDQMYKVNPEYAESLKNVLFPPG